MASMKNDISGDYYIYLYSDPRDGKVFYVGKGVTQGLELIDTASLIRGRQKGLITPVK